MNKLNKKIIPFVLLFSICLLVNVSFGAEFGSTSLDCTGGTGVNISSSSTSILDLSSYDYAEVLGIVNNFLSDPSNENYNMDYQNMLTTLEAEGINIIVFKYTSSNNTIYNSFICFLDNIDVGFLIGSNNSQNFCFVSNNDEPFSVVSYNNNMIRPYNLTKSSVAGFRTPFGTIGVDVYYSSVSIKQLTGTYSSVSWDGTSYYYKASVKPEPETPTMPTNSEIAQAVQAFYNSDYYKNNKDFKDFIVIYNYKNQYFSFIGHNYEEKFQQLIFPSGYKYNQQWWKFGLDGLTTEISSYLFNKYYWFYSTNDFGQNFSYNGKGAIKDLLDLNFPTSSIIVYSSNDYDVIYYTYNENNELTSEMETMPGDQYTYDETLNPTENEYNPLKDFIPSNPSQTILGDVDFSEINKTFEENKDILNIENASWLFTANNKLVGYFIGFLSLLIVFLIISRILGG